MLMIDGIHLATGNSTGLLRPGRSRVWSRLTGDFQDKLRKYPAPQIPNLGIARESREDGKQIRTGPTLTRMGEWALSASCCLQPAGRHQCSFHSSLVLDRAGSGCLDPWFFGDFPSSLIKTELSSIKHHEVKWIDFDKKDYFIFWFVRQYQKCKISGKQEKENPLNIFLKGDELCLPCCVLQKKLLNQLVLF